MAADDSGSQEAREALFNVVARLPEGMRPEEVRAKALSAGLPAERVDNLVRALQQHPMVRVGLQVNKEKVDKIKRDFGAAGLEIVVQAVLTLAPIEQTEADPREKCPACGAMVILTPDRQCPSCGVYVDKVSQETLLKRKIMEQERARVASQLARKETDRVKNQQKELEDALRAKIRAELEEEFGLREKPNFFTGRAGAWRAIGLVALAGGSFAGGWMAQVALNMGKADMVASVQNGQHPGSAMPNIPMVAVDRVMASLAAQTGGLLGGVGGLPGLAASGVDGPDGAASGSMLGIPGLMPGAVSGDESLLNMAERRRGAGRALEGASAASGADADSPDSLIAAQTRASLLADLAVRLAELGQLPRAVEVVNKLKSLPSVSKDAEQAAHARLAEYQVAAWAIRGTAKPAEAAEALRNDIQKQSDPAQRAIILGRVGAILATHHGLPEGMALNIVLRGGEALKSVSENARRSTAAGDWMISMGRVLTEDIRELARTGRWNKVEGLIGQLDALVAQAQGGVPLAGLRGMQLTVRRLLNQAEQEGKVMDTALQEIAGISSALGRAEALRSLATQGGDPGHGRIQAALRGQVLALEGQKGNEAAYALARLALLLAEAGASDAFATIRSKALVVPGPSKREAATMELEIDVGSELAQARLSHQSGQFGAAELHLRQAAFKVL